jgi:hypothetical protein
MVIILIAIGGYSIGGYWWLLIDIIWVAIGGYYVNGFWLLFRYRPMVVILLVVIDSSFINGYCIINYY